MNSLVDLETERTVLGLFISASSSEPVGSLRDLLARLPLAAEDFSSEAHKLVFRELSALLAEGTPCAIAPLWGRLRTAPLVTAAGGIQWLTVLAQSGETLLLSSLEEHSRQLRNLAVHRRLFAIGRKIMLDAGDPSVPESAIVANGVSALENITTRARGFKTLTEMGPEMVDEMNSPNERVIPTGIKALDLVIGGLPSTLIVVGGQPGTGKSAFCATLVQNLARDGKKVGVFSLEDEGKWLGWRLLADNSGISNFTLRFRRLNDFQMDRVRDGFDKLMRYGNNVLVDDRQGLTASDIVTAARHAIVNEGVRVIIVDHLGELNYEGSFERHDLAIADALSQLRGIAKRYDVPVVVCSQLTRRSDEKPGQEPTLGQFKNAKAIGEKARVALGLCREPGSDRLRICVLKSTNGKSGCYVDVTFHGAAAMIRSCEPQAHDFRPPVADA